MGSGRNCSGNSNMIHEFNHCRIRGMIFEHKLFDFGTVFLQAPFIDGDKELSSHFLGGLVLDRGERIVHCDVMSS